MAKQGLTFNSPTLPGSDHDFMQQALALAAATTAQASPNPQVGCVLVRNGTILGRGAHRYAGRDHAEIVALHQARQAGHDVRGACAYVTLEPCSHHGRTGPCADALIAAGIARCVVATADPNPQVAGRGIARLRAAGVAVEVGVCQAEARALNDAFAWSITRGLPFVTLKAALSVDGMLAPAPALRQTTTAAPHWLTGTSARAEVQTLRHAADALITGIGTVLADDAALTDRTGLPRRLPLKRVVLDRHLRLPPTSRLARTAEQDVHIFCAADAPQDRRAALEALGVRVTSLTQVTPEQVLQHLHAEGVISVLLEAGAGLNAAFLHANYVQRAVLYYAESELGPAAVPFAQGGPTPFALEQRMLSVSKRAVGQDVCVSGLLADPWAPATGAVQ